MYDIKNIYETKITETNRVTKARKNSLRTPIDSVDNNVSQSPDNVKRQSRSDADYLSAVKRGDMKTAQRMVDEAAERAFAKSKIRDEDGKLVKVYHGTDADFTVSAFMLSRK